MNIIILSVSSDIGKELANRYIANGHNVIGTYRTYKSLIGVSKEVRLIRCDMADRLEVNRAVGTYRNMRKPWDMIMVCTGTLEPIGKFLEVDFEGWLRGLAINCINPLRFIHRIYKHRNKQGDCKIVFLSGGKVGLFPNYSCYNISKRVLDKVGEAMAWENRLKVIGFNPGWVNTRIHRQTIKAIDKAGDNYAKTKRFMLENEDKKVDYDEIFKGINHYLNMDCSGNFHINNWRVRGE